MMAGISFDELGMNLCSEYCGSPEMQIKTLKDHSRKIFTFFFSFMYSLN